MRDRAVGAVDGFHCVKLEPERRTSIAQYGGETQLVNSAREHMRRPILCLGVSLAAVVGDLVHVNRRAFIGDMTLHCPLSAT